MDTRLLEFYNRELLYVRETGAEFAAAYPGIAAGLGLRGTDCDDPYVERLLEGMAFLAARVQLKLDARHPEFTQHLLEVVYPGILAPTPSCAVAEFIPDVSEGSLQSGVRIPRHSKVSAVPGKGERTACQFRTAHDVVLWPLQLKEARYVSGSGALASLDLGPTATARAAISLRILAPEGISIGTLPVEELTFFVKALPDVAARVIEQVLCDCVGVAVREPKPTARATLLEGRSVSVVGLEDDESLLPIPRAGFQGYRLLQEYFAFPERLLAFRVAGLRKGLAPIAGREVELLLLFDKAQATLENALDASHLRLYCTPIINLFPRSTDRVHVSARETEIHVAADRNRPMDYEIHSITGVRGIGASGEVIADVLPLHRVHHRSGPVDSQAYFTAYRRPRLKSSRQERLGTRTQYLGSEVYLSIVDRQRRQFSGELRQLDVQALCTNRDLALQLVLGKAKTDFVLDGSAPLASIRCIAGPSAPRTSPADGDTAWRLISQLSLNYLSLSEADDARGAETLRGLLGVYAHVDDVTAIRQIEGVRRVRYRPAVRRVPSGGPIAYGRGLEITLGLEESAFEGTGIIAIAAVLERFFARYASINSFIQLRLESLSRGEIKRWPARIGTRQVL